MFKNVVTTVSHQIFPTVVETDEDGFYIVSCPLFRACHSYGETIMEAIQNIKEAIELCVEEESFAPRE